jgi:LmbE family N-acetylglucosaminyl deacetylase
MNPRVLFSTVLIVLSVFYADAQSPKSYHSGEVQQLLRKLNVLGSALYIAAHPDDENTGMIAYLSNGELLRTAYLSTTRGDGGQNLIGPEIREGLGIIRTQELLAARRIDGGQQFFSRANDFGYSKHPDETLNVWDKDEVLEDYVKVIRTFRPDIIITRFSTIPGVTHGHHTTSAILAKEAFKLAGDPDAYPDQLEELDPWKPSRLFWNTSWWFYRSSGQKMDTAAFLNVDIGGYNSLLGTSYTEIAARSRSQHKSQGFGSSGRRGAEMEYLEHWDGLEADGVFEGIDMTWGRIEGGEDIQKYIQLAIDSYDPADIEPALQALYHGREAIMKLPDQFWKEIKLAEIDEAIRAMTGTYLEIVSDDYSYTPGDNINLKLEAIVRADVDFTLKEVILEPWGAAQEVDQVLKFNEPISADYSLEVPNLIDKTQPYWLDGEATVGMYHVADKSLIGKPENPALFNVRFVIQWGDQYLEYNQPISYKTNDPVDGEVYRPVVVLPKVTVTLDSDILVFSGSGPKEVNIRLRAIKDNASGKLELIVPKGWEVSPKAIDFSLALKNEEQLFSIQVKPINGAKEGQLDAQIVYPDGTTSNQGLQIIDYDHIPVQTLTPIARVKLINLDMKTAVNKIGYIMGAGDAIPDNLRQVGYTVDLLSKDEVTKGNLSNYEAVVLGVRAFNTLDWLSFKNQELFDFVEAGGTVIVQYNTSRGLVTDKLAPYALQLSRDRVTVEEAEVRILDKKNPVLNSPNKITSKDFEGWVQERGLYFPDQWDKSFTAVLSSNDPGEPARDGGLLVAKYGKGYYIYTGYSWFRELPAGVPGAYRIFSNLLSIGKQ